MTASLVIELKQVAKSLGFQLAGVAKAEPADHFERYLQWLEAGCAGEMTYLHKNAAAREHPRAVLLEVRSVVMLGITYGGDSPAGTLPKIARYAQTPDYHQVLWEKLNQLGAWLTARIPESTQRGVTDSAPLLERNFAQRAGLGWIGKNSMLIHKQLGSFLMLGALLTSVEFPADVPHTTSHCGTCTACIDHCPTSAIEAPGWLNATKCISYWTIEYRGRIPLETRTHLGEWLFGCDICQDVCPWNRHLETNPVGLTGEPLFQVLDPIELLQMDETTFRKRYRHAAFSRTKWEGILRNAAIFCGNQKLISAKHALEVAANYENVVISEAARWALDQFH
ncbi:MAG: tRNA epoxyqueuosine(34) reductase QueG [Zavarzinella sp.]